jgi:hypothetical protein
MSQIIASGRFQFTDVIDEILAFATASGTNRYRKVMWAVPGGETLIPVGETNGWTIIKNVNHADTNIYVILRFGTGETNAIYVPYGEFAFFKSAGSNIYALASSGTCQVEIIVVGA